MTTIKIPTAEQLNVALGGLDRLLTAKEWERAAIVYAFTTNEDKGGRPENLSDRGQVSFPASISAFAGLGFAGLLKRQTVAMYRSRWQDAIDQGLASPVSPGDEIELPDVEWPPTRTGTDGDAKVESRIQKVTEYLSDPEVRGDERVAEVVAKVAATQDPERRVQQVREALADPVVAEEVMSDVATRVHADRASDSARGSMEGRARARNDADPVVSGLDRTIAVAHLLEHINRIPERIEALPAVAELTTEQRESISQAAGQMIGYASRIRDLLASGDVDWDAELKGVNRDA